VQDGVDDAFTKRPAETAMKVADGFEPGAAIGPLIDMKAVDKVEAHIADAVKKGAKFVTGGKRAAPLNIEVGRQLLRADRAGRRDRRHGHHPRGSPSARSRRSTASNTSASAASTGSLTPMMGYPRYIPGAEWRRRCKCKSHAGATALACASPKISRFERACAREPGSR
jgi:ParB-like chromosome segregation protein Spo0J